MSLIKTLDMFGAGEKAKVIEVKGGWGLRQKLSEMGILPGQIVTVSNSSLWRGPILVQIHSNEVALGRGVARKILAEVVS